MDVNALAVNVIIIWLLDSVKVIQDEGTKFGGLDSQDLSRSRSRTSLVSRPTFLKCRDYPSRRDQLFFFSIEIFKVEIFQSRLICIEIYIEIVEINWDCRDKSRLSRFFEIYRDLSRFLDIFERFLLIDNCGRRDLWKL